MSEQPESSRLNLPPGCWPQRSSPVGYGLFTLASDETSGLASLATQVLEDPIALRQLSDRVFALLKQELQQENERRGYHGRRGQ